MEWRFRKAYVRKDSDWGGTVLWIGLKTRVFCKDPEMKHVEKCGVYPRGPAVLTELECLYTSHIKEKNILSRASPSASTIIPPHQLLLPTLIYWIILTIFVLFRFLSCLFRREHFSFYYKKICFFFPLKTREKRGQGNLLSDPCLYILPVPPNRNLNPFFSWRKRKKNEKERPPVLNYYDCLKKIGVLKIKKLF